MSQHTNGPWEVFENQIKAVYGRPGMDESELIPVVWLGRGRNIAANARLIAAAPDLLAALEGLTAIVAEYRERVIKGEITGRLLEHDYAELAAARAAIRKATEDSTHA